MHSQVGLVTGAAHGIGLATARALAGRGYDVHCVDLDAEAGQSAAQAIRAEGGNASFHPIDLEDKNGPDEAVRLVTLESEGRLDVIVNNAFRYERGRPLMGLTDDDWHTDLHRLLVSYMAVIRAADGFLHSGAAVINLASVRASFAGADFGSYSVAKAAVIQLTRSLALELGPRGVRVNAVAPGFIATDRARQMESRRLRRYSGMTPLGRLGTPDDVANAIIFLASKGAGFITGEVLVVDGGLTLPLQIDAVDTAFRNESIT